MARSAGRNRPAVVVTGIAVITVSTLAARRLGYHVGGNVVVRCRHGHLFTTLWIPGVNLKALDLVIARLQRCPVGRHWSLVVPVRDGELTTAQRRQAAQHHDLPIP